MLAAQDSWSFSVAAVFLAVRVAGCTELLTLAERSSMGDAFPRRNNSPRLVQIELQVVCGHRLRDVSQTHKYKLIPDMKKTKLVECHLRR